MNQLDQLKQFTTVVAEPVKVRETIVLPVGTVIEGRITGVEPAAGDRAKGSRPFR